MPLFVFHTSPEATSNRGRTGTGIPISRFEFGSLTSSISVFGGNARLLSTELRVEGLGFQMA